MRLAMAVACYLSVQATVAVVGLPGAHLSTTVIAPSPEGVRFVDGKLFSGAFDRSGRRIVHEIDGVDGKRSVIGLASTGQGASALPLLGCAMTAVVFAELWR